MAPRGVPDYAAHGDCPGGRVADDAKRQGGSQGSGGGAEESGTPGLRNGGSPPGADGRSLRESGGPAGENGIFADDGNPLLAALILDGVRSVFRVNLTLDEVAFKAPNLNFQKETSQIVLKIPNKLGLEASITMYYPDEKPIKSKFILVNISLKVHGKASGVRVFHSVKAF